MGCCSIQRVSESAGSLTILNHPLFTALTVAALIVATVLSSLCFSKADSYWMRQSEDAKLGNRYFGFFGFFAYDQSRALDIRMYEQEAICRSYFNRIEGYTPSSEIARYSRGPIGILYALSAVISALFTGGIYVFVCLKAWADAFGVGSVTQYIGAITALFLGMKSLIELIGDLYNNADSMRVIFKYLDIPNSMYQGSLTTEKRLDRNYEIEFRDVSFRYPSANTYALRHVNIKFNIGKKLAIVGQNGSGKTTFIKLLCRLYDPTEGEILLNGINIKKYNYEDYMDVFSVVFQDFQLFAFTLGQNVASGKDYDKKRAEECLKQAGFGERFAAMPNGLETYLYQDFDESGVGISGGEAQKIAIARALYKDAPFIILDEPTAALDPIAEYEIYSKFNEMVGDKTAVYISHRLSSCRFCDDIIVFDQGSIVQQGSHDKLIADEAGKYHELWTAQAQYYN